MQHDIPEQGVTVFPSIEIPPVVRATAEEIKRRQELAAHAKQILDQIGPLDISASDLIRQARDEANVSR